MSLKDPVLNDLFLPAIVTRIDEESIMSQSAVFAAVSSIAGTISTTPFGIYKTQADGDVVSDNSDPLNRLLSLSPNKSMTACAFLFAVQTQALLRGNGYAEIVRDKKGNVEALIPIPTRIVEYVPNQNVYIISIGEKQELLSAEYMFNLVGPSSNGIIGFDLIQVAKRSFSITISTEEHMQKLYENSGRPDGCLTTPQTLKAEAYDRLLKSWEDRHKGLSNAFRVALLEGGLEYKPYTLSPQESQQIETRKFQTTEVCRWFNVPPHIVKDLEFATYSNIEMQGGEYYNITMEPWFKRWEQTVTMKLCKDGKQAKFDRSRLNLPPMLLRFQAHGIAIDKGIKTISEVRKEEGMNPNVS